MHLAQTFTCYFLFPLLDKLDIVEMYKYLSILQCNIKGCGEKMENESWYKVSWIEPILHEEMWEGFSELGEAQECMRRVRKEGGDPVLARCRYMSDELDGSSRMAHL